MRSVVAGVMRSTMEVDVLVDPGREVGGAAQCEAAHRLPGGLAVARQVVAAHDRHAPGAGEPATLQRGDDEPQGAARRCAVIRREIGEHSLGAGGERARAVGLVASLGDRHGDDPGPRVRQRVDDGPRLLGGEQVLRERADHAGVLAPVGIDRDQGVEVVLRRERVAQGPVVLKDADPDEPPAQVPAPAEAVDVLGEVGAVEAADAEVDDLAVPGPAVVVGDGDGLVQAGQGRGRQCDARGPLPPLQHDVGEGAGALDGPRVARVDRAHPLLRVGGVVAVRDAPGHEPLRPQGPGRLHVPRGVEQRGDDPPAVVVVQQVVALGDDERHAARDRDRSGDRLLDGAVEIGGVDDLLVLAAQTGQE